MNNAKKVFRLEDIHGEHCGHLDAKGRVFVGSEGWGSGFDVQGTATVPGLDVEAELHRLTLKRGPAAWELMGDDKRDELRAIIQKAVNAAPAP